MIEREQLTLMTGSRLFQGFTEEQCYEIRKAVRPFSKSYFKNDIVMQEGERITSIGILHGGQLACTKFYYEGNSHLLNVLYPSEMVGMETVTTPSAICPMTVTAMADSSVLFFPYERLKGKDILPVEHRIAIMENIIHLLGNEGIRQIYKAEVLAKRSLREKILTHLYLMRQKAGRDTFPIYMNQEQFAQYLCVNRSALSSQLNKMEKEGLLSFQKDVFTLQPRGLVDMGLDIKE